MKSRRWIAAAALAAAVVFLVMVTGEHGPAAPRATPAPVSSSGAVLASDGGPPENDDGDGGNGGGGGGEAADREELIGALQALLDALGVSADELAEGADNSACGNGGQDKSDSGNGNDNNGGSNNGSNNKDKDKDKDKDKANGGCEQSEPASAGESAGATITIKGFAFGQPLTVAPGTTVEVVNTDAAPHNVTATDRSFKTSNLNQDETATFTAPTTPGRYEFTCTLHPEMTGTLIVEAGAGGQGGSRSSEPATGSQRGGGHDSSGQHESTAPERENTGGGSSDGY
ncbi:cupredoxin domain-containing protein [Pseudonocardia hierapolitana]|nr:cupredoxin domain-containing protein [Pseudonocardia hierapolitana]